MYVSKALPFMALEPRRGPVVCVVIIVGGLSGVVKGRRARARAPMKARAVFVSGEREFPNDDVRTPSSSCLGVCGTNGSSLFLSLPPSQNGLCLHNIFSPSHGLAACKRRQGGNKQ